MMRGDAAEEALLERATDLITQRGIDSDDQLGPLFQSPADADPDVIRRLRQMFEAGGWVLLESAIADLPADLRWLFESGAVRVIVHQTFPLRDAATAHRVMESSAHVGKLVLQVQS